MKKNKVPVEKKHLLQIISFFAAIILWFAVTYSEDPTITVTISDIPLKTVGERYVMQNDLVLVGKDKLGDLSIDVRGKRSAVKSILNSVSATLDLSDISEDGQFTKELYYEVPNQSVMIVEKKRPSVTVTIEKAISKKIPVSVVQTSVDKNKELLVKSTAIDKMIEVSGTSEDVSKIKGAVVTLDASVITADSLSLYTFSYFDEAQNIYTPKNNVKSSESYIEVENKIYLRKEVPVLLNPAIDYSGYQFVVKSFSKDKVTIGVLPDSENDVTGIYADFVEAITPSANGKYKMKLIIPSDVYCPLANEEITMNATLEQIETKDVSLNISVENLPSGKKATVSASSVNANMTGAPGNMNKVRAVLDLSDYNAGEYDVTVKFITDNTGVRVNSTHNIHVTIS